MKNLRKWVCTLLVILPVTLMLSVLPAGAEAPVKNVILMIGDGMGINHIMAARMSLEEGAYGRLHIDTMPYTGFSITFSENNLVTDSAAAKGQRGWLKYRYRGYGSNHRCHTCCFFSERRFEIF